MFKIMKNDFTLIELLVVISIIGILTSILLPSLSNARYAARNALCKNNQKQILIAEYVYSDDNEGRLWATSFGSGWLTSETWNNNGNPGGSFHGGQAGFLVPYLGEDDSDIYSCPATDYDKTSQFYTFHEGKSYEGLMDINVAPPVPVEEVHVRLGLRYFLDASRKPLFWDYTAEIGGTSNFFYIGNSSIHRNTGRLNLAVTDGSVVPMTLPTEHWNVFVPNVAAWLNALENATGESAGTGVW